MCIIISVHIIIAQDCIYEGEKSMLLKDYLEHTRMMDATDKGYYDKIISNNYLFIEDQVLDYFVIAAANCKLENETTIKLLSELNNLMEKYNPDQISKIALDEHQKIMLLK